MISEPPPDFDLTAARVTPAQVFFAGRPLRIRFRFDADGPVDLRVEIRRRRRLARRFLVRQASPGSWSVPLGRVHHAPARPAMAVIACA